MIKKIIYILMLLLAISIGSLEVEAKSDVVLGTGEDGTVTWTVYDDGDLVFSPTDGVSGEFENTTLTASGQNPWSQYKDDIRKISFEGKVNAGTSLAYRFSKLPNLEIVGPGLDTSNVRNMMHVFEGASSLKDISGLYTWDTGNVTDMSSMFNSASSLTDVNALSDWNTGNVTNMRNMFYRASALKDISGLSNWDTGNVTNMMYMFRDASSLTDVNALSNWQTGNVRNMSNLFAGASSLKDISGLSNWNTGNVTYMSSMFDRASALTEVNALSDWKTGKVTNMSNLFAAASSLKDISGLSTWDTGNVNNMRSMFHSASSLTDVNALSNWQTGNVRNMNYMFYGASSLTDISGLSNWNTGNVTDMIYMFRDASSLTDVNALSKWKTGNVRDMSYMFYHASSLKDISGLSAWDTGNVTNMKYMFASASSLTDISGLSNWNTGNATDMSNMFDRASSLNDISGLSNWNTGNVTDMSHMFNRASALTDVNALSDWNTGNVTDMSNMFDRASSLTDVNALSDWKTGNVRDMSNLFAGASSLKDISGLSNWNTGNVTNMRNMFYHASSLTDVNALSKWKTGNVRDMSSMFYYASSLKDISGLSTWDTGNVTNMGYMFRDAISLTDVNALSTWDTGNVTDMTYMFAGASSLTDVNALSTWDTGNVTNMSMMFRDARSLKDISGLSTWDTGKVTNMMSMFYNAREIDTLEIGEKTRFHSNSSLTNPPKDGSYTGKWVKKDGTQEKPLTTAELIDATKAKRPQDENLTGNILGVWIWEEVPQTYTLKFNLNGGLGTIPDMTPHIKGGDKLPGTVPIKVGATFKGWSINNVIYKPGDTLKEVKVSAGGTLTAKAVWNDFNNKVTLNNGEFTIDIPAGQAVTVPNLPAGLGYDIYEQTPSGWLLVKEVNSSGKIKTNDTQVASFENEYQPNATSIQFKGFKYLDGVGKAGFEFELKNEKGESIEKVTSSESGGILFKPIKYTEEGTYTYTISEKVGADNTIEYDKSVKNLTVDVVRNKDGNLEATLNTSSNEIVFNNKTKPAKLTISKVVNGTNANNIPFDLVITIDGVDHEIIIKNGETVTSNDLRPGAYYSVKEINLPTGYTLNNISNQEGYLKSNENINIVVTNDYTSTGSFVVKGSKVLEGRELQPGEFSFELLDSQGVIVDKVMNDKDGNFVFNAVSLFKPGTYTYKVKEVKGTDSSIVYDSTIKEVEVVAVDNGDGTLKTTVKYINGDIVFTNKTTNEPPQDEPETGEFSISKVVTNATDTNQDNAFDVKLSLSNSDKSALDGSYYFTNSSGITGYVTDNSVVKIKDGEKITIKGLPLGAIVSIEEKVPKGYTLNNNSITSGVISEKQLALKLQNDYYAEGEFIYKATKYLRSAKLSDYKFKFEMRDGFRVVARGESDANGNITFTPIKYSLNDVGKEFTYQITEVNDKQTKIRYDNNTYEIKVKVMDNGDGVIKASTKDNSVVFRNAYDNDMPATGTYGTWILVGVAVALVTIVVALEVKKRK